MNIKLIIDGNIDWFLMRWVFMHTALKGCRPPHTNEPVQFWIGTNWWEWLESHWSTAPSLDNPASD